MFDGLPEGLSLLLTWETLGIVLLGTAVGTVVAILPGISMTTMLALMLPLVVTMQTDHALALMVTIIAAGGFAGSLTAILLNIPGDSINASTTLDGFPLARAGKAGVAIGAAAAASSIGAIVGFVILVTTVPVQRSLVLSFGPSEIFALSVLGIALLAVVSTGSVVKGLVSGLIGMGLGFIGVNLIVGGERFTFGLPELQSGVPLIAAVIGLFGIPEIVQLVREGQTIAKLGQLSTFGVLAGVGETLRRPRLLAQSSVLGTLIGIIPGVGAVTASWVSYFAARRTSRAPDEFGHGNVEGVIASEAAIDTSEAGSLVPVFVLGLPGSVPTALLLVAFTFHGIVPGTALFTEGRPLIWVMLAAFLAANVLTVAAGLGFSRALVKITVAPIAVFAGPVLVFALVGAYAEEGGGRGMFNILVAVVFGLLGIAMQRYGYPRAPLIIGLVLLPLAEKNFHQALQIHRYSLEFLLRPITLSVLLLTAAGLVGPVIWRWLRRQERMGEAVREKVYSGELAFLAVICLVAVTLLLYPSDAEFRALIFPLMVLVPLVLLAAWQVVPTWLALKTGSSSPGAGAQQRSFITVIAWTLALPLLMLFLGVILASVLYVGAFAIWWSSTRRIPRTVAVGIATAGAVGLTLQIGFQVVLGVRFYEGLLRQWLI